MKIQMPLQVEIIYDSITRFELKAIRVEVKERSRLKLHNLNMWKQTNDALLAGWVALVYINGKNYKKWIKQFSWLLSVSEVANIALF